MASVRLAFKEISAGALATGIDKEETAELEGREYTIGDKIITYRSLCFGELFSVIITGNFTACNSWGN